MLSYKNRKVLCIYLVIRSVIMKEAANDRIRLCGG